MPKLEYYLDFIARFLGAEKLHKGFRTVAKAMQTFDIRGKELIATMKEHGLVFTKTGKIVDAVSGKQKDISAVTRAARIESRRFRFEWLGIMFAGMRVKQVFTGLIEEGRKLAGTSEILADIFAELTEPAAEREAETLDALADVVDALDESTKLHIGSIMIWTERFGTVIEYVASLFLALYALKGLLSSSAWAALVFAGKWALIAVTIGAALYGLYKLIEYVLPKLWDWLTKIADKIAGFVGIVIPDWLRKLLEWGMRLVTPFVLPAPMTPLAAATAGAVTRTEIHAPTTVNITANVTSEDEYLNLTRDIADRIWEEIKAKTEEMR